MKLLLVLATALLISLSCMAGVAPRVKSIDVVYIGSLWDDLQRDLPLSAGVTDTSSIRVAHTLTTPSFLEHFLQRMGLHDLLDELGFDFVIGDTLVHDRQFFPISRSMGYAIKNYREIRFAMVCSPGDSLTVQDQTRLTLLKERSDILWVIDKSMLAHAPSLIRFHVSQRALSDTSISKIKAKTDTARVRKIQNFKVKVEGQLNRKIPVMGRVDDHVFSMIAEREMVDAIIYPSGIFRKVIEADSLTLGTLLQTVAFETRFSKTEMSSDEIARLCAAHGYRRWGSTKKLTRVLLPDTVAGKSIFDYYY
ncbi:hypothetical protein IBX73_09965 [candidate division WOR-3 bacterium]|nr:hypothetical protein [candidate division WOR-3 bacterium]